MYVILSLVVYIFLSFSFLENELIDKVNWNSRSSIANIVNYTDEKWTKHSTRRRPKINDTGNIPSINQTYFGQRAVYILSLFDLINGCVYVWVYSFPFIELSDAVEGLLLV
jgi:uncharacterized membrane protein